jgi:hypothetical protein
MPTVKALLELPVPVARLGKLISAVILQAVRLEQMLEAGSALDRGTTPMV